MEIGHMLRSIDLLRRRREKELTQLWFGLLGFEMKNYVVANLV
jgi:hypothetical protein